MHRNPPPPRRPGPTVGHTGASSAGVRPHALRPPPPPPDKKNWRRIPNKLADRLLGKRPPTDGPRPQTRLPSDAEALLITCPRIPNPRWVGRTNGRSRPNSAADFRRGGGGGGGRPNRFYPSPTTSAQHVELWLWRMGTFNESPGAQPGHEVPGLRLHTALDRGQHPVPPHRARPTPTAPPERHVRGGRGGCRVLFTGTRSQLHTSIDPCRTQPYTVMVGEAVEGQGLASLVPPLLFCSVPLEGGRGHTPR